MSLGVWNIKIRPFGDESKFIPTNAMRRMEYG
jgi:hypothetical protein